MVPGCQITPAPAQALITRPAARAHRASPRPRTAPGGLVTPLWAASWPAPGRRWPALGRLVTPLWGRLV